MASNKYGKVGSGTKVHALRVSDANGRTYPALCGAGENHIGTRKRSPLHIIPDADASCVTCSKCQAILDSENVVTDEQRVYQVGDTVTLNKNDKDGTIRYVKAEQAKPYGVFLHQSGSTHYYAAADLSPDDTEPLTARDAMQASEDVLADSWNSDADEEAFAELGEPVIWRNPYDLPVMDYSQLAPVYQYWRVTWLRRQTFAYNAPVTVDSKPSRDLKARQGRTLMNMQRRVKSAPKTPKKAPTQETVLQIVSHIETPLTGGERRIA